MAPLTPPGEFREGVRRFAAMLTDGASHAALCAAARDLGITTMTSGLDVVAETLIAENPRQAAAWLAGDPKMGGFFLGLGVKATNGRADIGLLNACLSNAASLKSS